VKLKNPNNLTNSALDSIKDIFFVFNPENGKAIQWNKATEEITGYSHDEIAGAIVPDFYFDPNEIADLKLLIENVLETGFGIVEVDLVCKSGQKIPVEYLLSISTDDSGSKKYITAIGRNITVRREAETTRHERETHFRLLMMQSPNITELYNIDGLQIEVNKAYEELWGFPASHTVNKFNVLKSQEVVDTGLIEYVKCAYAGESVVVPEYQYDPTGDTEAQGKGRVRWLSTNIFPLKDLSGDVSHIVIQHTDITKRKIIEEDLRQSEERFKVLHNASFGGITIHDKGIILECNKGLSDISGYDIEELIGMNGLLLIAEPFREAVLEKIATGNEKPYEATGIRKNGKEYPLRLEARTIPYKGKMVRVVEFRDISEQKSLENQLRQSQKMESIGHLAGGIAHDFNNLLTPIIGNAEFVLMDMPPSSAFYNDLHEIYEAATRAGELTRQLLAFSRKQILDVKLVDLNNTITNFRKILRRTIREDIKIEMSFKNLNGFVKVDISQVEQILMNLFINAQDAMPEGGTIFLETDQVELDQEYTNSHSDLYPGYFAQLSVSDTGQGMTQELTENIFDPFFTTKEVGKGTGLGLSTTHGIIKQHGGSIWVYSEPGRGTTFKIYLPIVEDVIEKDVESAKSIRNYTGSETVLIVEDQDQVRKVAARILETHNYKVHVASGGKEAIEMMKAKNLRIDLLLTDVVMPDMNGKELYSKLSETYHGFKVLFMSGYAHDVISHHGIVDKEINFVQKPLTVESLIKKVKEVLTG
jgi:PAS domain S-box-containing protein